jgi:hypothetical protein
LGPRPADLSAHWTQRSAAHSRLSSKEDDVSLNPYVGTAFEESWGQGFTRAFLLPDDEHTPPSPLEPEQQTAFAEGVLSGRDYGRGMGVGEASAEGHSGLESLITYGETGLHAAGVLVDVVKLGQAVAAGAAAGPAAAGVAAGTFWLLVGFIFHSPHMTVHFEDSALQALNRVRHGLREGGLEADNIELFMAACDSTGHEHGDDELTRIGWWHGHVFRTYEQARSEALAHGHAESTRVLRVQTAVTSQMEILELAPAA